MAAKRYSAGAIFLQVVPVFANVQRAIEDEAKNIDRALGDTMEKSGEKAGERAGKAASKKMSEELAKGSGTFEREMHKQVDGINKALDGINTNKLSNGLRKEVATIKRKLAEITDLDLTVDADFRKANEKIADLEGRLRAFRDDVKIVFRSDVDNALKGFAKIQAAKESISDPVEIEVSADFRAIERQMTSFERSFKKTAQKAANHLSGSMGKEAQKIRADLKALEDLRIGVDISSNRARAELQDIMYDLDRLSTNDPEIDVRVDAARAMAEIAALDAAIEKLDGQNVDIDIKTNAKTSGRDADAAANSFRSFNIILLATASIGPAVVPVLGAIAGGLAAIGPAAAVAGFGLTSVLIGFSGLSDAMTALQAQEDQAAIGGQTAARTQESNARRVADAQRAAAEAVRNAIEQKRDAQEAYRDSVLEVKDAEQALKEARADARGTGQEINEDIRQNALDLDQALLDSFNATVEYNAVMADGSSTNAEQEQARINREQALEALRQLRDEQRELAAAKKKWDKDGVNGTEQVQSAQDNLNDALDAQKDAYENLRDAAREVDEARAEGARNVAEAMRGQADALGQISAQQNNVNQAFEKLGPAGRAFALFLFGLRDEFYAFRDDIQSVLLPAVQEAIEGFFQSKSGSNLRTAMIALAGGFGQLVKALSRSFQGKVWREFFEMLGTVGPKIQRAYGRSFIAIFEALASILTTLAPFSLQFARGFARIAEAFAEWADSKSGQRQIREFLGYVREVAPTVLTFFRALAGAVVAGLRAIAPYGQVVLELLTHLLEYLAQIDPKTLGAILTSILVLITASQIAYAVMNLLMAGAALLGSTVGVVIFALVGIGLAVAYLYKTNEEFRDFIQKAWKVISEAFVEAWERFIKPALMDLWDAISELWTEVLQPLFDWLGPVIIWIAQKIIPLLGAAFSVQITLIANLIKTFVKVVQGLGAVIRWLWKNVMKPTWEAIAKAAKWLWRNVLKPTFEAIGAAAKWLWRNVLKPVWEDIDEAWDSLMRGMKWVWNNVLKPVFDFIGNTALPKLQLAFSNAVSAIKTIWDGLKKVVGAPIRFVLETIINKGLIAGFNKVSGWVKGPTLDPIPIPEFLQSYATGGVMPGYTPGRDPHKFVSPTGGRLELSGGEGIVRPEVTRAVGPGWIHGVNNAAMSGGVNGVRRYLQGGQRFAKGGIFFPLPGGYIEQTPYNLGHDGVDINAANDEGKPFYSATSGRVTTTGYSRGYGNAVFVMSPYGELVYGHSQDGSIGVRPGQSVSPGSYLARVGSTGNSSGPHLHFGFPGGSFYAAMALLSGADPDIPAMAGSTLGDKPHRRRIPSWLMGIVKDPLAAVKGWVTSSYGKATDFISDSPVFDIVKKVPLALGKAMTDKVWDVVPGWVKTAAGWAGDAAHWVVGGVKNAATSAGDVGGAVGGVLTGAVADALGFKDGGILPYNGTMKYDSGGMLPPGMTTVMNLTGKPEPVFTNEQWSTLSGGAGGGSIHYEPHFEGSDLTAGDVAGDLNFTFRRIRRQGKYAGVGSE